jgi:hypothetical protein
MNPSFEQTLVDVWRQALIENAKVVALGAERYPVRQTTKRHLREVDFVFDGNTIRGLEQNPDTKLAGLKWRVRARRSCNSSAAGATWRTWWMGR